MDDAPISDEQLARQVQRGISESLAVLIDRYYGPLIGYFCRMRNSNHWAVEDLTQAAFLRVIGSFDRYRYPKSFRGWLYAIAAPFARDHANQPVGDGANPVAAMLEKLPDLEREALILRYAQGLSLREIATVQRVLMGKLKSRMWAGLSGLKKELGSPSVEPVMVRARKRADEETNWLLDRLMEDTQHPHLADHMLATGRAIHDLPAPPINSILKASLTLRLVQEHRARIASRQKR